MNLLFLMINQPTDLRQIERVTAMVVKRTGVQLIPFQEINPPAAGAGAGAGVHLRPGSTSNRKNEPEFGKPAAATALAELAMAELLALARLGEPMWARGTDGLTENLNQAEYGRAFANGLGPKNANLATEATRTTAIVAMPAEALVDMLMDVVGKNLTPECVNALPQRLILWASMACRRNGSRSSPASSPEQPP